MGLIGIFSAVSCNAQEPHVIHQSLYWLRFYGQYTLNPNWSFHTEIDERRYLNTNLQSQFFIHLHAHYKVNAWLEYAGGLSVISTNATVNTSLAVPERRLFQEVSFTRKFGTRVTGQFRFRVDERFIHRNNRVVLEDGYNFSLRERFRWQVTMALGKNRTTQLKISDELMIQQGQVAHPFDQNRIYAGLELPLTKTLALEPGVMNLYQSRSDDGYFSRNVIRITLYGRFKR